MPGRDPAVHTHLPSPSTSPQDERPTLGGRHRSSSSAFARVPSEHHYHHGHGAPPSGTQGRRVSTPDGPISRLLRRVSMSTEQPPERSDVENNAPAVTDASASESEDDHEE